MKVLLIFLVCGTYDCHWDRQGVYDSFKECYRAAGYEAPPRKHPHFKCVVVG